jgi:hypothetical protein
MERGESRRRRPSVLPIPDLLIEPGTEVVPKVFGKRGGWVLFRIIQRFEEFPALFLTEIIGACAKFSKVPFQSGDASGHVFSKDFSSILSCSSDVNQSVNPLSPLPNPPGGESETKAIQSEAKGCFESVLRPLATCLGALQAAPGPGVFLFLDGMVCIGGAVGI